MAVGDAEIPSRGSEGHFAHVSTSTTSSATSQSDDRRGDKHCDAPLSMFVATSVVVASGKSLLVVTMEVEQGEDKEMR